jgi:uncharacterized membrane protein
MTAPHGGSEAARRVPAWQAWAVFVVLTALYAAISFQQYRRMDAFVFDLGFFEAVVRDYAHARLPELPVTDTANAALHFSPALSLLAPLVLLVPSPLTILFAQAVAVAAGVVPLMRVAGGGRLPWVVAVSYGLAPGFGALIGFDFHEVALAVPLLSLSMAAMLRADHRAAVLWALPLILVKEDLGLTIAALGLVVVLRGSRRWGAVAMVFGTVSFLVLMAWVLPAMNGDAGGFADKYAPSGPSDALRILSEGASNKLKTVLFLLVPTGVLALRSPMLLVVALPTYGWRFLSDRPTYWDPWYQYDAVLVPIAVAAMIEGALLLRGRPDIVRGAALSTAFLGTLVLLPQQALAQSWNRDFWRTPPQVAAVDRALDKIPDGSRVAASDNLGARIALRTELYLVGDTIAPGGPPLPPSEFGDVEWVAFDRLFPLAQTPAWLGFSQLLDAGEFEVVDEVGGVIVARRRADE